MPKYCAVTAVAETGVTVGGAAGVEVVVPLAAFPLEEPQPLQPTKNAVVSKRMIRDDLRLRQCIPAA